MRNKMTLGILMLAGFLTFGAGSVIAAEEQKAGDPRAAEAAQAIADADAARKQAASVKGEWRDTGKIIKSAKKAADAGKYDEALKLAKKAQHQGEMGYEQAVSQAELRMPAYLKY